MNPQDNNDTPPPPQEPEQDGKQATGNRQFTRIIQEVADYWGVDPARVMDLGRSFIKVKGQYQVPASKVLEFLMICREHKLNPATREIYGFYSYSNRNGWTLQTGVEIDGWLKLANQHPQYDAFEIEHHFAVNSKGERIKLATSCTVRVFRKDRSRPTTLTLDMDEWQEETPVWNKKPNWQLGVKAIKHGLRCAFGFAGIGDLDVEEAGEGARGVAQLPANITAPVAIPAQPVAALPHKPVASIAADLEQAKAKQDDRAALGVTPKEATPHKDRQAAAPAQEPAPSPEDVHDREQRKEAGRQPDPEQDAPPVENNPADNPPAQVAPRITAEQAKAVGGFLAKLRKARKLGLGSAAAKLNMESHDLTAIEAGDLKAVLSITPAEVAAFAAQLVVEADAVAVATKELSALLNFPTP